jgi:hypothetical protein
LRINKRIEPLDGAELVKAFNELFKSTDNAS